MENENNGNGGDEAEDYVQMVNMLKTQGNDAFQKGDIDNVKRAIRFYSEALQLDPDNHIIYSNRSAAHMKADSKSDALRDAEKCIAINPKFVKGYNRLGVAQQSLRRFTEAIDTFKKGIAVAGEDPSQATSNAAAVASLWSALSACQAAYEADKQARFAAAKAERALEEERRQRREKFLRKEGDGSSAAAAASSGSASSSASGADAGSAGGAGGEDEDAILASFLGEVTAEDATKNKGQGGTPAPPPAPASMSEEEAAMAELFGAATAPPSASVSKGSSSSSTITAAATSTTNAGEKGAVAAAEPRDESTLTQKYVDQDLGDTVSVLQHVLASNYEFKNLNPYHVLGLDIDATEEDIKYRYRKLSSKIHPDKVRIGLVSGKIKIPVEGGSGAAADLDEAAVEALTDRARDAFEQVKGAYVKLTGDGGKLTAVSAEGAEAAGGGGGNQVKRSIIMHIELVRREVAKERKRLIAKGMPESSLPPLDEEIKKRTMKHFAEIEMKRRASEKNLRAHSAREKQQEAEEKAREKELRMRDREWGDEARRENRVSNWREMQNNLGGGSKSAGGAGGGDTEGNGGIGAPAKKFKAVHYKEEKRETPLVGGGGNKGSGGGAWTSQKGRSELDG